MLKNTKGFSLIELMITVGIIGILSLLAMPIYQDYVKKAMIAEGLELASSYKSAIESFVAVHGRCPNNIIQDQTNPNVALYYSDELPISGAGNYVESLSSAASGTHMGPGGSIMLLCGITITYREDLGLGAEWNTNSYTKPALNFYYFPGRIYTGSSTNPPNQWFDLPSRWICVGGTFRRGYVKGRLLPKECYMNMNYVFPALIGSPELPIPPNLWN